MRATMQEGNREEGIISSDNYYFFYIITVNEKSYVRKLKDVTFFKGARSRFAHFFQVCNLQSLLIFGGSENYL